MFYSQVVLARKGPLGILWLSAHFDKKLTKNQIFSTDISESVDSVIHSSNPLALRVSGHLMLGIVRIYSRKVKYLMSDCTEAMWKIKLAFRPGNVNLLESHLAVMNQIDDQRFFGRIAADTDFPELEDLGFSTSMLANDEALKAAREKSLASRHETIQDNQEDNFRGSTRQSYSPSILSNDDNIILPGYSYSGEQPRIKKSTASNVSTIEKARAAGRHDSDQSLGSSSRLSYFPGLATNFDDDNIPAYEEYRFDDREDDYVPPIDNYTHAEFSFPTPIEPIDIPAFNAAEIPTESDVGDAVSPTEEIFKEMVRDTKAGDSKAKPPKKEKRKLKKQRVQIDNRVELSNHAFKDMLNDVSNIVRRRPGDPFPPMPAPATDNIFASPLGPCVHGLCRELREVYDIAISRNLPFEPLAPREGENHDSVLSLQSVGTYHSTIEQTRNRNNKHDSIPSVTGEYSLARSQVSGQHDSFQPDFQHTDTGYDDYAISSDNYGLVYEENQPMQGYDSNINEPSVPVPEEYGLASPIPAMRLMSDKHTLAALLNSPHDTDTSNLSASVDPNTGNEKRNSSAAGSVDSSDPEKWNKRTKVVLDILKEKIKDGATVSFDDVSKGASRRAAAAFFLEILQLQTWGFVEAVQDRSYGDISIVSTDKTFFVANSSE